MALHNELHVLLALVEGRCTLQLLGLRLVEIVELFALVLVGDADLLVGVSDEPFDQAQVASQVLMLLDDVKQELLVLVVVVKVHVAGVFFRGLGVLTCFLRTWGLDRGDSVLQLLLWGLGGLAGLVCVSLLLLVPEFHHQEVDVVADFGLLHGLEVLVGRASRLAEDKVDELCDLVKRDGAILEAEASLCLGHHVQLVLELA